MHHELKIDAPFWEAKKEGLKPFEIRINDRGFQKGDTVSYRKSTGANFDLPGTFEITYVTSFSQRDGWVVFAEKKISDKFTKAL